MFCQNCGNKLNGNETFCPNCGNSIPSKNSLRYNSNITLTQKIANKTTDFRQTSMNDIKSFFTKYKKQTIITLICVLFVTVCLVFFSICFGFDKLSWNKEYGDYKLKYVSPTKIKLGVNFENKEKIKDLKYKVTCGEYKTNGPEIEWDLNNSIGNCKITVSYKLRKISKEFTVIKYNINEKELRLDYKIDVNSDEDLDLDGLTNKQEKQYNTNPVLSDTDMDGLDDNYELTTSKTNPLKKDSDDDGLSDYDELKLNLDPLKIDSKGDGVKDGKRTLTYTHTDNNLKLTVTGTGNIVTTIIDINSNTKISNKKGFIDKLYNFYTEGNLKEAKVAISYTDEELKKYNLKEDNLSMYYYNEEKSTYERIKTTINKEKNIVEATLNHFSRYVVGDTRMVKESSSTEILFVLDNSWSMYSIEEYEKITGKKYLDSKDEMGYDVDGVRFSLTSNLITNLSKKNYKIGLSEFRRDYKNALKIGSSEKELKDKLNNMYGNFITKLEGTNIAKALSSSLYEFSTTSDNKYIVILTDGRDSNLKHLNYEREIIETALLKNIKICSIGFGSGSNNEQLSNISNATGCKFYSSSNSNGLVELFENINAQLDDQLVDINNDNKTDGLLLADSGFVVNRDGFSFGNYGTNLSSVGHCYGMATFAQLYYKKQLPLKFDSITVKDEKTYAYDLTNTYFKNYNNLYDYKLQTNALKYTFGYELFDEIAPTDIRIVEGTKLTFNKEYKNELNNTGIYDLIEQETTLSKEDQIKRWGVNYQTSDVAYLNEDKMQTSKAIKNDDLQMLNAIWTAFIKQHKTTNYSSGMNFITWARKELGTESILANGEQGFINILKTRLNDKDAPVISANYEGGLHAINAISLVQDIDNPNYYYIGVYDNNYPGQKRYVDIKCNKNTCETVANEYYSGSGEPIRVTLSLEADLAYYD